MALSAIGMVSIPDTAYILVIGNKIKSFFLAKKSLFFHSIFIIICSSKKDNIIKMDGKQTHRMETWKSLKKKTDYHKINLSCSILDYFPGQSIESIPLLSSLPHFLLYFKYIMLLQY